MMPANTLDVENSVDGARPFVFDDSTIDWHLKQLVKYCENIPFEEGSGYIAGGTNGTASGNWAQVLFGAGDDHQAVIDKLVRLYNAPETADGLLPPQQALLLAWLRQLETPRKLLNMLPALHRQLYYRDYLGLSPRGSSADSVALIVGLDENIIETTLKAGTLFAAGQDAAGTPLQYALEQDLIINQGQLSDIIEVNPSQFFKRSLLALPEHDFIPGGQWLFSEQKTLTDSVTKEAIANSLDKSLAAVETALSKRRKTMSKARYFSHPSLCLGSGQRIVMLTIEDFKDEVFADIRVELHQDGNWVVLKGVTQSADKKQLVLTFDATDKPLQKPRIAANDTSLPVTQYPLLRISRAVNKVNAKPVGNITHISVEVKGAEVLFSTDTGDEKANKPSLPLGQKGELGNGFNMMSADWANVEGVIDITITPVWAGLSNGFSDHYKNYIKDKAQLIKNDNVFTVLGSLCKKGDKPAEKGIVQSLFASNTTATTPKGNDKGLIFSLEATRIDAISSSNPVDWPWYLRVALDKQDFLSKFYEQRDLKTAAITLDATKHVSLPQFIVVPEGTKADNEKFLEKHPPKPAETSTESGFDATKEADVIIPAHLIQLAADIEVPYQTIEVKEVDPDTLLTPPYQPQWSSVVVDYKTSAEPGSDAQWLEDAFGFKQDAVAASFSAEGFTATDTTSTPPNGDTSSLESPYLLLGFNRLIPLAEISLYWQLRTPCSHPLKWDYLAEKDHWKLLNATIKDDTLALSRSGLWSCVLPEDASSESAIMPAGKHWLRVTFNTTDQGQIKNPEKGNYPLLYSVYANTGRATLIDAAKIDDGHFGTPLPAGTIVSTVNDREGIAKITQPWPSFGGKAAETDDEFNNRIAQRLRHRNRALSWRDISTLLVAKYPEIQALKLGITNRAGQNVVIMPYTSQADNDDILQPTINQARLDQMAAYLKSIGSEWLNLKISNPHYFTVDLKHKVTYRDGIVKEYGDELLKKAIQQRFMPWATEDSSKQLTLGNGVNYYDVLAHMEMQDYVKNVDALTFIEPVITADQVVVINCMSEA